MLEEDAVEVRTLLIHSRTLRATKRAMSLFSLFFLKLAPTFVAALLQLLTDKIKDYKHLTGPKKIYLDNVNLMYALSGKISEGTARETFFANQVRAAASLMLPKQGDFLVDGKYTFEVGGSSKNFSQIAGLPDSYLAVDDIEVGSRNRLPLWMFGMLY